MEVYVFEFLPLAVPTALAGAPLVQVIAQVKFENQSELSTHEGVGKLHDRLSRRYPRLLPEPQHTITASPSGISSATVQQWRMTDLVGNWSCVVGPEQLALETKNYETWESCSERLAELLKALAELTAPRVRERVGLRYVNQIPAGPSGSYVDRVKPQFLGVVGQYGWGKSLAASLSQTILQEGATKLALRYGTGADVVGARDVFVLDIDCFNEQPTEFDEQEILASFNDYNDVVYRCFAYALDEGYLAELAKN